MSSSATLQSFVEELLLQFDTDIDLSPGAPAQRFIVEPIVKRFEISPFEMDVPAFVKARLQQEFPRLNLEDGEPLADVLLKAGEALLDPVVREVKQIKSNQSLQDVSTMAVEEVEATVANHYTEMEQGDVSRGTVRVYYSAPRAVSFTPSNVASTASGLHFLSSVVHTITAEQMLLNQVGDLYYVDVAYQAEKEGTDYDVEAGQISSVTGLEGAVRVTNLYRFRGGSNKDTAIMLRDRDRASLSNRAIVNKRGALAKLAESFGDLLHLQTVGLNDPEMERDIIRGGGLGPVLLHGTDGATADDGDGDGRSKYLQSTVGGFLALGAAGPSSGFVVEIDGEDRDVVRVVSDNIVELADEGGQPCTLAEPQTSLRFSIRKRTLTLSDIPGGIVNPNGPNGTLVVVDDEIHIGGCMDLYVRGTGSTTQTQTVEAISDESPLLSGTDLEVRLVGGATDVVRDSTADFRGDGVRAGMTMRLKSGPNANDYTVLKVLAGGTDLQVHPVPATPDTVKRHYEIVDDIDVDLNEPKTRRGQGSDMITTMGSDVVSTTSGVDFSALGAAAGDTLRITSNTLNKDDYLVSQVSGTGNTQLELASTMRQTLSTETWELFRKGAGVDFPMLRITDVGLMSAGTTKASGVSVPYADPIFIRASAFSNVGVGTKKEVRDARIGIIGTVDLSSGANVSGTILSLIINQPTTGLVSLTQVSFSGANPVSASSIVSQINAIVPGLADTILDSGKVYLTLRSHTTWVQVASSGTANPLLGFVTSGYEDNRQVSSPSVADWSAYKIQSGRDAVYVRTGQNAGQFYYLHTYTAGAKLYVSYVDSEGKAIFPLPGLRDTVRVGSRSIGKVRCYFLSPTSFEVQGRYRPAALASFISGLPDYRPNRIYGDFDYNEEERAVFSSDAFGDQSAYYRYFPDPELKHQLLPEASTETPPDNLKVVAGSPVVESEMDVASLSAPGKYSRGAEVDFLRREILPGDEVEITYQPIEGTGKIDAAALLVLPGKTLVLSLENGDARSVTFTSSLTSAAGAAAEINQQAGATVAYIETDAASDKYLRLEADFSFELLGTGTANSTLGLPVVTTNNDAPAKGRYIVESVGYLSGATSNHMKLQLDTTFAAGQAGNSQHFIIRRPGLQRCSSTIMQTQTEGSLYYADVELVSEGPGNEFNLEADAELSVAQHSSDGWTLVADDRNLTFSEYEKLKMRISRRFLQPGQTDTPQTMTLLTSRSLEIEYEKADLVEEIQAYALSELDRTLVASIVVRHLTPHYVYLQIDYTGGSKATVVEQDIEDIIDSMPPGDEKLEASAISDAVKARGATSLTMPITLFGVVWDVDRKVKAVRSQDAIGHNRMATFLVGKLTINRSTQ